MLDSSNADVGVTMGTTQIIAGKSFIARAYSTSYAFSTPKNKKMFMAYDTALVRPDLLDTRSSKIDSVKNGKIYFFDDILSYPWGGANYTMVFQIKEGSSVIDKSVAFKSAILNSPDSFTANDTANALMDIGDKPEVARISVYPTTLDYPHLEPLNYTIHFQNTFGTAYSTVVRDTISELLDLSTIRNISGSPGFEFQLLLGRILEASNTINTIPDSTTDFLGSQGFISFTIDPVATLQKGQSIINKATVAFNYDQRVVPTNQIEMSFDVLGSKPAIALKTQSFFPNPTNGQVQIMLERAPAGRLFAFNASGQQHILSYQYAGGYLKANMNTLPVGLYTLRLEDGQASGRVSLIR
jgi:hypothetical protein